MSTLTQAPTRALCLPTTRLFTRSALRSNNTPEPSFSAPPVATASFTPRATFPTPEIRSSYYLGHHQAGLRSIESQLPNVDLVLECRDARLPLSSWNPTLEKVVSGTRRLIVYTKSDLIANSSPNGQVQSVIGRFHQAYPNSGTPIFWDGVSRGLGKRILQHVREIAEETGNLMGLRVFVVGMPNVGKSTLLNKLRSIGLGGGVKKAAATANHPGVTRKLSTPVRIMGGKDRPQDAIPGLGVFLIDTPGVFMPYVADKEVMLKIAVTHGIKDGILPHEILADYLLFKLNQWDPTGALYSRWSEPTNDIEKLLTGVLRETGKGQNSSLDQAAAWLVARWRTGGLGRYLLEEVTAETLQAKLDEFDNPQLSFRQAKKQAKQARKDAWLQKPKGV